MPKADGQGRVPATEVLVSTALIRDYIINKEKTRLIPDAIAQGVSQYGMQTFDQSLYALLKKGMITYEEALFRATNPEEFKLRLQGISSTSGMTQEQIEEFTLRDGTGKDSVDSSGSIGRRLPDGRTRTSNGTFVSCGESESCARERALSYLGRFSRTRKQVADYLRRKEFTPDQIQDAIAYLVEHRYLNDDCFC